MEIKLSVEQTKSILSEMGISAENAISLPGKILDQIVKPSDLGFTTRELSYWGSKEIIDLPSKKDGEQRPWCRLNLLEVIWIRIVRELRKFDLSFENIVKIKKELFADGLALFLENPDQLIENLSQNKKDKEAIKNILKQFYIQSKKHPELLGEEFMITKTFLGVLLSDIILYNSKVSIHIYDIDKNISMVFEGCRLKNCTEEELAQLKLKTRISLNLNELIAEYLTDDKFEKNNTDFGLFSEKELQIIAAIRKKEVIKIIINKDSDEVLTFTTTERGTIKDERVQILKRILRMHEFNDVRVVLRNGKDIYLENNTKKKL